MVRQATGTEIVAGMAKGSAWGTAVALGPGDGIYILTDSLESSPEILLDESLGNSFAECADLGNITAEGDIETMLKYEGLLLPFALCLGIAGAPTLLTNGYKHILKCSDNIHGLFATYAVDKILKVHEVPSIKIAGFTISGEAGDYVRITFNIMGNILKDDSVINTSVTMATVTYLMKCGNILFNNGKFLLKDYAGNAPAIGDRVYPSSFEIEFNRNLEGDYTASGSNEISEPEQAGQPELNVSLEFPRYTDARFISDLFSKTEHEMIITFEGDTIGAGPDKYSFSIELARLIIADANVPLDGLGKIPFTVNYRGLKASALQAGFSDDGPITLTFVNTFATDPLV